MIYLKVPIIRADGTEGMSLLSGTVVRVERGTLNPSFKNSCFADNAWLFFDTGEFVLSQWRFDDPDTPWWPKPSSPEIRIERSTHTIDAYDRRGRPARWPQLDRTRIRRCRMNPKLIGFCGYARSGKDTAAKALIDLNWKRVAFADALKDDAWLALNDSWESVYPNNGINPNLFHDSVSKEIFRPFLVEYGRAMRNLSPDYWIDRAMGQVRQYLEVNSDVVITDVRYQNEVDAIHAAGGKVIMIGRTGIGPANEEERQSFEQVAPDIWIPNHGTVADLHALVMQTLGEWGYVDLTNPDPAL